MAIMFTSQFKKKPRNSVFLRYKITSSIECINHVTDILLHPLSGHEFGKQCPYSSSLPINFILIGETEELNEVC